LNMRLFADLCLPTLQRDAAFSGLALVPDASADVHEGVFAPA